MWTPNRIVAGAVALAALIGAAFAVPGTVTPQIGGGISSFDGGISAVSGVTVNPNCAQGATYIAALTAPSGTEQTAFKTAICGMVADGTWPILKGLYIFANTSAVNARVNAASPGTFNLAQTGTCPFTADVGMAGDGTTCFNDPSFIPSVNGGGVMTATSASFGVCVLNTRGSINENSYGGTDGTFFSYLTPYFTSQAFGAVNDAGLTVASTGSAGSWIQSRTGSAQSDHVLYLNATALGSGGTTNGLVTAKILEHAFNNNGTTAGFSSDQHAYWFFGGGLSAGQVASVYSRLGAMLNSLGIAGGCSNVFAAGPFFFNSTTGADTNNCLSATSTPPVGPCLTPSKLNSLLYAGGADITMTGTGFTGCIALTAANVHGSAGSPINLHGGTVTSTCGGANSGSSGPKTAAILLDSISATVNGVTMRGSGFVAGSATQYGIAVQNSGQVAAPTYLIENNDISGFGVVGLTGSSDQGADIFMGGFTEAAGVPQAKCGQTNVTLLNNTLHGSTTTSGENNGFFGTGCGSGYLQQTQGNLIFNISGINNNPGTGNGGYLGQGSTSFVGPASNSYIQFSLAHDIGANGTTCGGPVGLWAYQTYGALLTFDEVYNVQGSGGLPGGACDFSAFDFDIQAVAGLAQYLYGHNTGGPGFVFFQAGLQDVVRYSIFENTGSYNEDGGGAVSVASGGGSGSSGFSFQAYNNTIFQNYTPGTSTPPSCLSLGFGASYTGGLFANNVCHNAVQDTFGRTFMIQGNSATGVASITMKNNDYFNAGGILTTAVSWPSPTNYTLLSDLQTGTSQETGSKIITTGFTAPPTGTCTWTPSSQSPTWPPSGCPSAYSTLAAGLKSAGANLASTDPVWFVAPQPTTAGTRDYYGNTIPGSGSCYNMGAFGTCP